MLASAPTQLKQQERHTMSAHFGVCGCCLLVWGTNRVLGHPLWREHKITLKQPSSKLSDSVTAPLIIHHLRSTILCLSCTLSWNFHTTRVKLERSFFFHWLWSRTLTSPGKEAEVGINMNFKLDAKGIVRLPFSKQIGSQVSE